MAGFKQIKIFTDTNIIHAAQAHLLISTAVHKYISEHKEIESVDLKWFIPSMVLEERKHQMLNAALALTPKINDLEKLLGHSLGINSEVMEDRINSKIAKTIQELALEICEIDTGSVDWDEIMMRSAHRKAPFEISTEKEKGFRDAIIATTFLQEIIRSPKTPRACLLVFVSGDKRVKEYIEEKTLGIENVRILDTLDELKSLLNAIASEITEEFLEQLQPIASKVFYDFDKEDGLYKKEGIYEQLTEQYKNELESVTADFPKSVRNDDSVTLGEQTFIKKTGQTVIWSSSISLEFKVIRYDYSKIKKGSSLLGSIPEKIVLATGTSFFSVLWQHQVSTKGNAVRPKINGINFIENVFDDEISIE
jgi:PIN domain-containing protein